MKTEEKLQLRADALIEALPYLQQFRGRTFLIKVGGSAMEDAQLVERLIRDIAFIDAVGIRPVIVHGGGKAINAKLREAGIKAQFIGGLRVTDPETMAVVEQVLDGPVQQQIVETMREQGSAARGLSGKLVFRATKVEPTKGENGEVVDLGLVGEVESVQPGLVLASLSEGVVPIISPLGIDINGNTLNINADIAASALAISLRVSKCIYLSDVPGIMRDPSVPESLISSINGEMADKLIAQGIIQGGMIPKVRSALEALEKGVEKVHFIDGRISHSLLLEIFTTEGIGTQVVR
jgi:acetylglutamate kinase